MGIGRPLPTCMCILKNLAELGNFIGNNFIDLVKFLETKTESWNFPCHKDPRHAAFITPFFPTFSRKDEIKPPNWTLVPSSRCYSLNSEATFSSFQRGTSSIKKYGPPKFRERIFPSISGSLRPPS